MVLINVIRYFVYLRACEVHRFAPACAGTKANFNHQSEQGALALAVKKKLGDLFMRQPGHFFLGNGEFTHVLQRVWCCPFSKAGQFAEYAAQIALLQIDSYRAGTFLPLLAKLDFIRQAFIAVMREQFETEIVSKRVSECIDH